MIIAALLPILVIVLSIEWVKQITTGEIIVIAISLIIGSITFVRFMLKITSPNRSYKMALFNSSIDKLISNNKEVTKYVVGRDNLVEAHVRIVTKTGANIHRIRFRLVRKGFPYWRWVAERSRYAFVERIWDKDLEREREINPNSLSRGEPSYLQENESGILYFGNRNQLKDDIMWYRVIIHANADWDGYLEYCAPSGDGRWAYSRRKISFQFSSDRKDSQH